MPDTTLPGAAEKLDPVDNLDDQRLLTEVKRLWLVLAEIAAMSKQTDGEQAIQLARDTFDRAKPS